MKFATFYDGNSFQFAAAEPDDDFLNATRVAADFARTGKREEALAAYTAAAEGKLTDLQKSHALEQAAALARFLRKPEVAAGLAARIPIPAVKQTVLMENLLDQAKAPQVVAQFGGEDIGAWPFWKAGDGYFARGRAYAITKAGQPAEADLTRALEWSSDPRVRDSIRQALASNRENNLEDEAGALAAYREMIAGTQHLGSADQFHAVQGIARILTKRGQFDEALATLRKVDLDKQGGFWRGSLLLSLADTQLAAGRKADAEATYKSILADAAADPRLRKLAEEKLATKKLKRP
jgi:predicted negative regulator of RcsB-dependent stress response